MDDQNEPHPEIITKIKEALSNSDLASAAAIIEKRLEDEKNIPLNIAVTGETGSGKSSFVNAFRGVSDCDKEAAPTDCVETTMEPKSYPHPSFPNVLIWDLPGIGTSKFPADKYLELVGFEKFDFFIIISNTRFRENDVKLAKEIKRMGKNFYFIRSKIDEDLRSEQRKRKEEFNEQVTLAKIREYCVQGLQKEGFESPQVFLISNPDLRLYDFARLHETLERELPEQKRHVLLMSMPNINLDIINKKKKTFMKRIWWYTGLSGAVAALPVPGISVAVDLGLLVDAVTRYVLGFGLDPPSLRRLAASSGVPFSDLLAVIISPLAADKVTKELMLKVVSHSAGSLALMTGEEVSRFIPIIGIPLSMTFSATTTYNLLKFLLNMLAEDAQRVFKRALNLNPSQ